MGYISRIMKRNPSVMERLRCFLDHQAAMYNVPEFADNDPVQFPRRFSRLEDREIVSLLCSTIAWGNRKMICRDCERLIGMMGGEPYEFLMDKAYEDLPDGNIHRTFFVENLRRYMRGLRDIYAAHGSLQGFARHIHIRASETPSWHLVAGLNQSICEANGGVGDSRCLPQNLDSTALKRVNMALRWLVRNDGIVDMGCWDVIKPSQLFIPMDVHVGNQARALGLLERKANDRKAVMELTALLRDFRPEDPVVYDFALFGIGITGATPDLPDGIQ